MVIHVSAGMVMATEPAIQAGMTTIGIILSLRYVRRLQQRNPDLGLLPVGRRG